MSNCLLYPPSLSIGGTEIPSYPCDLSHIYLCSLPYMYLYSLVPGSLWNLYLVIYSQFHTLVNTRYGPHVNSAHLIARVNQYHLYLLIINIYFSYT